MTTTKDNQNDNQNDNAFEESFSELDTEAQKLLGDTDSNPNIYKEGLWNAYASTLVADDERFEDPMAFYEDAKAHLRQRQKGKNRDGSSDTISEELLSYFVQRNSCLEMRRLCTTQKGHVGMSQSMQRKAIRLAFSSAARRRSC